MTNNMSELETAKRLDRHAASYEKALQILADLRPVIVQGTGGNVEISGVPVNARDLELLLWDGLTCRKECLIASIEALK